MIKILNKSVLVLIVIVFIIQSITNAQNTPSSVSHLLSITEGITSPFRIAVKSEGTIYVTDVSQNNIVKYDNSYNHISTFNTGIKPAALAVNSQNEIFIGDLETGIIYKLDSEDNPTIFSSVVNATPSMVFDKNDLLYVVDSKLKQVTVLDTDGNFLRSIGSGLFVQPTAISYDSINERILVSEHGGLGPDIGGGMMGGGYPLTQVWILDTDGNQLGTIGEGGSDNGEFYRIQGTAVSKRACIYVTDPYQASINVFEENGTYLNKFGDYGRSIGQLNIPMDVKFDSQDHALVSSMNTGAIEVYYVNEINPTYKITAVKKILCPGENTDIKIDFTGSAPWTFTYTKDGTNPVTVAETYSDPYIFNTSEPGVFKLIALSDSEYSAIDLTDSVVVTQNPYPTSTITSGDVEICTGTNTDVLISFTGVAPFNFTYTNGISPVTIYNNTKNPYTINTSENGSYEVTYLKDGNGCVGSSLTGVANINVNDLPSSIITSNDAVICEGETTNITIEFTGTAPWTFTHSINGLDQTPITTIDNPYILNTETEGLYTVTALSDIANTGECFTGSVNISVTPVPTSTITSDDITICKGETADVIVELTGTPPWNLTYTVNGLDPVSITDINASPYIITAHDSGLYEVGTLIGNNCSGLSNTGSAEITVNPLPTSVITEGNDQYFIYEGETYDFSLELTGKAPWTYTYVIDNLNPITVVTSDKLNTITGSAEGTYEIKEISDLNCTNYRTEGFPELVYDPAPSSLISSGYMAICEGSFADIQIDLSGVPPWSITYTKDGINPTLVTTNTSPYILTVSEAGLYKVIELSDANLTGTRLIGEAIISVLTRPTSNLQGGNISFCEGVSNSIPVELTGTAPWNFTYTIDDLSPKTVTSLDNLYLLNINQSGVYKITSISDANCEGNSTEGIADVTINSLPDVNLGENTNICEGEFITLDGGSFSSYLWNNGSITRIIDVNSSGTFSLSVTDENGCENSDEIIITVLPLPVSDFTFSENHLEISFNNTSINSEYHLWDFGDSNTSIEPNPTHTYESPGEYNVMLTASNETCGDSTVTKTITAVSTSIENIDLEDIAKIYPNPSNGLINIEFETPNKSSIEIEIRNLTGQRVLYKKLTTEQTIEKIDCSNFPNGVYTINIISKDKIQTQKLILSK